MHRNYFSVGENEGNIPEIASVIEVSVLEAESLNALPTTETDLNTSWSFVRVLAFGNYRDQPFTS